MATPDIGEKALADLIRFVRYTSPFYQKSLARLSTENPRLEDLPIVDSDAFWKANSEKPNGVMTAPFTDGYVVRSGGSTGPPKWVYMTKRELEVVTKSTGCAMSKGCGLVPGDRIANLSHHGSMYGSSLLFTANLHEIPMPTVSLPISGNEGLEAMAKWMEVFDATVILTNVSTARRLAEHYQQQGKTLDSVRLILYSGENFTKPLRAVYKAAFPNATMYPSLYGSVDAGTIAVPPRPFTDEDDDIHPIYKTLTDLVILEIVDDHGVPITSPGKIGSLIATHLHRRQQPLLRYPLGDKASWVDYHEHTFRLHGRDSSVGLKISTTHLPLTFLRSVVVEELAKHHNGEIDPVASQFLTCYASPSSHQQVAIVRIATREPVDVESVISEHFPKRLEQRIAEASPTWVKNRGLGNIGPLQVEWISPEKLVVRKETGKLVDVIEERY